MSSSSKKRKLFPSPGNRETSSSSSPSPKSLSDRLRAGLASLEAIEALLIQRSQEEDQAEAHLSNVAVVMESYSSDLDGAKATFRARLRDVEASLTEKKTDEEETGISGDQ